MKHFLEKHGLWVLLAIAVAAVTLAVLAVTALTVRRKNGAGAAQSKDEAA